MNSEFIILLIIAFILMLPTWKYSKNWGYGPSGIIGIVLIVLMILWLLGLY